MSKKMVAERAGMSLPTVNRVLSGNEKRLSITSVDAIAKALGVVVRFGAEVGIDEVGSAFEFRKKQATEKAQRLMGMLQATMGLEAQAISGSKLDQMVQETACELLAGPPSRLWG